MSQIRLNNRIIIKKFSGEDQNDNGFDETLWDDFHSCWCEFREVSGKEFIAAKANNSENIVTFTVRYCNKTKALLIPGETKKYKVICKNNEYDIKFCSDYNNLHNWIDIKAEVIR